MSRERSELEKLDARLAALSPELREQELARLPVELAEAVRAARDEMLSQASLESLAADERLDVGRRIGPYVLRHCLGEGGMGTVYLASRGAGAANLALKVTQRDDAQDLARFEREARVLKELRHPNICTAIDHGVHDGMPYLVMELVTGKDLRDFVRDSSVPLDPCWCAEVILQAAEGLAAVHAQQVVHRDIKPRNVMVEERGGRLWVKIVDFGICRLTDGCDGIATRGNPGTFHFASPEQLRGSVEVEAPSDIFSLALTAVYMLTGGNVISLDRSRPLIQSAQQSLDQAGIEDPDFVDCILRMLNELPSLRPHAEQIVVEMRHFLGRRGLSLGISTGIPTGIPAGISVGSADAAIDTRFRSPKFGLAMSAPAKAASGFETPRQNESTDSVESSLDSQGSAEAHEVVPAASRVGAERMGPDVEQSLGSRSPRDLFSVSISSWLVSRGSFRVLSVAVLGLSLGGLFYAATWRDGTVEENTRSLNSGTRQRDSSLEESKALVRPVKIGRRPLFDYRPMAEDLLSASERDRPYLVYLAIPPALIPLLHEAGIKDNDLESIAVAVLATLGNRALSSRDDRPKVQRLGKELVFRADLRDVFFNSDWDDIRPDLLWSSELSDYPFALLPSESGADEDWMRMHEASGLTLPAVRLDWLVYREALKARDSGQSEMLDGSELKLATWYESLIIDPATLAELLDQPLSELRQIPVEGQWLTGWNWEDGGPNRVWESEVRGGESLFQFFSRSARVGVPVLMQ